MIIYRQIHTSCRHLAKNIPRNAKGGSSAKWLQRQLADPFIEMAKKQNYRYRTICIYSNYHSASSTDRIPSNSILDVAVPLNSLK